MKKKIILISTLMVSTLLAATFAFASSFKDSSNYSAQATLPKYNIFFRGDSYKGSHEDTEKGIMYFTLEQSFKVGEKTFTITSVEEYTNISAYYDYKFVFNDNNSIGTIVNDDYAIFSFAFKIINRAELNLDNSKVYCKYNNSPSNYVNVGFVAYHDDGEYTYYKTYIDKDTFDTYYFSDYGKTGCIDYIELEFTCVA